MLINWGITLKPDYVHLVFKVSNMIHSRPDCQKIQGRHLQFVHTNTVTVVTCNLDTGVWIWCPLKYTKNVQVATFETNHLRHFPKSSIRTHSFNVTGSSFGDFFCHINNDLDDGPIIHFQAIRLFHLDISFVQSRDLRNTSKFFSQLFTSWRLR